MARPVGRRPVYTHRHLGQQIHAIDRHLADCATCRTWKSHYLRNPQCQSLRILVNGLVRVWHQIPAGHRARQLSMFDSPSEPFDDEAPPPF